MFVNKILSKLTSDIWS